MDENKEYLIARVLDLKTRGYSNVGIAQNLGLSESKVRRLLALNQKKDS